MTANTYTYVNGNPLNNTDPDGHKTIDSPGGSTVSTLSQFNAIRTPGRLETARTALSEGISAATSRLHSDAQGKSSRDLMSEIVWGGAAGVVGAIDFTANSFLGEVDGRAGGDLDLPELGLRSELLGFAKRGGVDIDSIYVDIGDVASLFIPISGAAAVKGARLIGAIAKTMKTVKTVNTGTRTARAASNGAAVANGLRASAANAGARGGAGPVSQGAAGVERTVADLEAAGGRVLGREVTVEAGGVRTRPDLFAELPCGTRCFIEVKTGPSAGLTPNQATGFPAIRSGGAIPRGGNAAAAGLTPGVPMGPTPAWTVWQPWPLWP